MKITIEIDIPEGYELSNDRINLEPETDKTIPYMMVKLRKVKLPKDFDWYAKEYVFLKTRDHSCEMLYPWPHFNEIVDFLIQKEYNKVSFEIKIGLFKFICDDNKTICDDFISCLAFLLCGSHHDRARLTFEEKYSELCKIIPSSFLNSIF